MDYITGDNFKFQNTAITLGKFDGLHLGHQLLIKKVKSYKELGYNAVMFTFNMHPMNVLFNKKIKLLYTEEEKVRLAKEFGMDMFVSYPFTKEVMAMSAKDFIVNVLVKQLGAKVIVVGADYRFGNKRMGDVALLKAYGDIYGFEVVVFEKLKVNDAISSSSIIRQALLEGDLDKVNKFLGRPYSIYGEVEPGNRIGRTIGMPTINIRPSEDKAVPIKGVYVSKTIIDNIEHESVTSIGNKPTVTDDMTIWVETFIFNYSNDLYGKKVEVELYKLLREEIKFNSLDELKNQMVIDIASTKEYFKTRHIKY